MPDRITPNMIISGMFVVVMAVSGWAITSTVTDLRDDFKRVESAVKETNIALTDHLINHPDRDVRTILSGHDNRIKNLEVSQH
jgi:hypothetical protein